MRPGSRIKNLNPTPPDHWLRQLIVVAAWLSLAVMAYATLSRASLVYHLYYTLAPFLDHPSMRTYARFEHVLAYMVVGALFAVVYPRSMWRVCLLLCLGIACLEALQNLTPDRHGTLRDAIEKMAGGMWGVFLARLALLWVRAKRAPAAP